MAYRVKLPPIRTEGGEKAIDGSLIHEKLVTVVTPVTDESYPVISRPFVGHSVTGDEIAAPPMTDPERLAALEEEEALFRMYWRTLPSKALAQKTWPSELVYYCGERGLGPEMLEALARRVRDLREDKQ